MYSAQTLFVRYILGQIWAFSAESSLEGSFTSLSVSGDFRNQGRWTPSGALFHNNVPAEVRRVCVHLPVSLVRYLYSPLFFPEAVILSFFFIFYSYTHTHQYENKKLAHTHAQISRSLRTQRNQATLFTIFIYAKISTKAARKYIIHEDKKPWLGFGNLFHISSTGALISPKSHSIC